MCKRNTKRYEPPGHIPWFEKRKDLRNIFLIIEKEGKTNCHLGDFHFEHRKAASGSLTITVDPVAVTIRKYLTNKYSDEVGHHYFSRFLYSLEALKKQLDQRS